MDVMEICPIDNKQWNIKKFLISEHANEDHNALQNKNAKYF